jgi:hypothetical protein
MILGHLAIAVVGKQTVFQRTNLAFLAVAALLPDILDKPANFLLGLPGRGAGHTLIVFAAATCLVWLLSPSLRKNPYLLLSGMVMWGTHLAGDFVQWPVLLWPFAGALEPTPPISLAVMIHSLPSSAQLTTNLWVASWDRLYQFYVLRSIPEEFWLDLSCIMMAVGIVAARSMFLRPVRSVPS